MTEEIPTEATLQRRRSEGYRLRIATFPDGSQILISEYTNQPATVAKRADRWATWGIPVDLEEAP